MRQTIFNEKIYLNEDEAALLYFQEKSQQREERWANEQIKYSNIINNYQELITKIASFIRTLGYKSSIECSFILSYLISCGYLSSDLSFDGIAPDPEKEITSSLGTSIVHGVGCCRNYSKMHKEVFDCLGLKSRQLYCYQGPSFLYRAQNSPANHVVSLIEHQHQLYAIDLYNNNHLFHFKNAFILGEISPITNLSLRYKPYYELIMGESDIEKIKQQLCVLEACSKNGHLNPYDYKDVMRFKIIRRLRFLSQSGAFDAFHEETKSLKKEIATEMTSYFGSR